MRKESVLLLAVFLAALTMTAACKRGADSPDLSKLGPSSAATSTVLPVGSPTCPGGGIGIYTGGDTNGNGVLEASEILKGTPVCHPLTDDGKPTGLVSLVTIATEPSGTLHCLAGGVKVLSGPDANKNGALDADEIVFSEYLCNGTPGASSASGITVAMAPASSPADKGRKGKKAAPSKKPKAPAGKAAPHPDADAQAATPKKASEKTRPASGVFSKPAKPAPKGWTSVKVDSPQLASAAYKVEGRYITVRFTNLSATSVVRFKYTVRWKVNQGGTWVDDSTMEGIGFRLKPGETLDREVLVQAKDFRDVAVDLDVFETS